MSRQLLSRADQIYYGRVTFGPYQADKPGLQTHPLYRWKPVATRAAVFTAGLAAGASSGTLTGNWAYASGLFLITFSDGETLMGKFTNGSTAVTFFPATPPITGGTYGAAATLVNAVTATASVANLPAVVGVANAIALSQAITTAAPGLINGALATAGVATLDVPRNVVAAWTGAAVLTVTGTDQYGQVQTESSASGTSLTGKKAFMTITSITVGANVTAATVGTGNVLGLPFKINSGDVFAPVFKDAADAGTIVLADLTQPATATSGDVRGTYAPAGTLDGVGFVAALIKPSDPTTQFGSFGLTPV